MEKLIELLNEYEAKRHKTSIIAEIRKWKEDRLSYLEMNWNYSELLCISKGYLFIQRLVDNDKIDLEKVKNIELPVDTKLRARVDKNEKTCFNTLYKLKLLMLLSIQDNPIEFLCEILK